MLADELRAALPARIPQGTTALEHVLALPKSLLAFANKLAGGFTLKKFVALMRYADRAAEADEHADDRNSPRRQLTADQRTEEKLKEAEQLYFQELLPQIRDNFLGSDNPDFELLPLADRRRLADDLHAVYQRVKKSL